LTLCSVNIAAPDWTGPWKPNISLVTGVAMESGEGTRVLGEDAGLASSGVHISSSDWLEEPLRALVGAGAALRGGVARAGPRGRRLMLVNTAGGGAGRSAGGLGSGGCP